MQANSIKLFVPATNRQTNARLTIQGAAASR